MPGEPETPLWNKLVALGVVITLLALLVIFRHRIGADFWPLDASRVGPNLVASIVTWAAIFTVTVLLYPPWRRRLHRFVDQKLQPMHTTLKAHGVSLHELHQKHDALIQSHQDLMDSHQRLHEKLDNLTNND